MSTEEHQGGDPALQGHSYGAIRRQLARRMVQLHKEYYGKGPTHAKAYLNDDTIVILMRGGFTTVEETLLERGKGNAVLEQRTAFQEAMGPRFREMIREVTGRDVVAIMSSSHQSPDLLAEFFVLDTTDLLAEDEVQAAIDPG